MAVLQISKIQVRRGQENITGVPTLSAGEFAWSTDVQRLYIGNGSTAAPPSGDGAPTVGNTEILTANSISNGNLFSLESYQYAKNNPIIQTGPTNFPVIRTLQSKLDDTVTAFDFGAIGDGVTDSTVALQQAINQLFNNTNSSLAASRVPLRIPAGTYLISDVLKVPPYATIIGDGIDRTIIQQTTAGKPVIQFCGWATTPGGTLTTWNDGNIQSGRYQPQNITIEGMTVGYANATAEGSSVLGLIEADCAIDSKIVNIKFEGANATPPASLPGVAGIEIRAFGQTATKKLKINNCIFEKLSTAIVSNYDTSEIYISYNQFRNLTVGVDFYDTRAAGYGGWTSLYSTQAGTTQGPQHVLIQNNRFENIYEQAVFVGTNTNNAPSFINSVNNEYINCGNRLTTEASQKYEVLGYYTPNNTSVNDYFGRADYNLTNTATTLLPTVMAPAYIPSRTPTSITVQPQVVTYQPVLTVAKTPTDQVIKLSYIATQDAVTRRGDLSVVCNTTNPVVTDSFTYVGATDGGIQFTATVTALTNALTISALVPNAITYLEFEYNQLY
jgi:hypothetical protein